MGTLTNDGNKVCPSCEEGTVMQVEEEYICHKPCGFRSSSPNQLAWQSLSMLIKFYRAMMKFAVQADDAAPGFNIIKDFRKFLSYEEL